MPRLACPSTWVVAQPTWGLLAELYRSSGRPYRAVHATPRGQMVLLTLLPVAYASAIDLHAMGKLHLSSHAACSSTWVVAQPTWGLPAELHRWFGRPYRAMRATPRGQMVLLTVLPVAYASAIDRHAMGKLHLSSHAACPSTWVVEQPPWGLHAGMATGERPASLRWLRSGEPLGWEFPCGP